MKHNHMLITLLALIFFNNFLFSMDQKIQLSTINKNQSNKYKSKSTEELIQIISKTIDEEYPYTNATFPYIRIPKNMLLKALTIIDRQFKFITPSDDFIDNLSKKNKLFEIAISEYTKDALKNFQNVTCDTLHSIADPHGQQPTPELNQLPLSIKKYVMKKAYNQIKHTYDITLSNDSKFATIALCAAEHLAFTTHQDGSGILWSLTTGKSMHKLPNSTFNGTIWTAFNNTGSQIATAQKNGQNNTITIYSPTLTKLFSIDPKYQILGLQYLQNSQAHTLCVYTWSNISIDYFAELWSIDKDKLISLGIIPSQHPQRPDIVNGDYRVPSDPSGRYLLNNSIVIKKTNNCQLLYLCKQALKQTENTELFHKITTSDHFIHATEIEQKLALAEIEKNSDITQSKQINKNILLTRQY